MFYSVPTAVSLSFSVILSPSCYHIAVGLPRTLDFFVFLFATALPPIGPIPASLPTLARLPTKQQQHKRTRVDFGSMTSKGSVETPPPPPHFGLVLCTPPNEPRVTRTLVVSSCRSCSGSGPYSGLQTCSLFHGFVPQRLLRVCLAPRFLKQLIRPSGLLRRHRGTRGQRLQPTGALPVVISRSYSLGQAELLEVPTSRERQRKAAVGSCAPADLGGGDGVGRAVAR